MYQLELAKVSKAKSTCCMYNLHLHETLEKTNLIHGERNQNDNSIWEAKWPGKGV